MGPTGRVGHTAISPAGPPTQKGRGAGQDVTAGSAPRHSKTHIGTLAAMTRVSAQGDQPIRVPHQALKKAPGAGPTPCGTLESAADRKSTRLNSSHQIISYAVFCLKKKKQT